MCDTPTPPAPNNNNVIYVLHSDCAISAPAAPTLTPPPNVSGLPHSTPHHPRGKIVILLALAILLTVWTALYQIVTAHKHIIEHLNRLTHHLEEVIELATQDAINAIAAQLTKAKTELIAKLVDAQAQIDAAGVAEQVDLSELTSVAQALDDIVPDPTDESTPPTE